jgi:hypothetical protein
MPGSRVRVPPLLSVAGQSLNCGWPVMLSEGAVPVAVPISVDLSTLFASLASSSAAIVSHRSRSSLRGAYLPYTRAPPARRRGRAAARRARKASRLSPRESRRSPASRARGGAAVRPRNCSRWGSSTSHRSIPRKTRSPGVSVRTCCSRTGRAHSATLTTRSRVCAFVPAPLPQAARSRCPPERTPPLRRLPRRHRIGVRRGLCTARERSPPCA